jgi:hypothetical protein
MGNKPEKLALGDDSLSRALKTGREADGRRRDRIPPDENYFAGLTRYKTAPSELTVAEMVSFASPRY